MLMNDSSLFFYSISSVLIVQTFPHSWLLLTNSFSFCQGISVPYPELFWRQYTGLRSQTQTLDTLKSIKINSSKNRLMTIHALVHNVLFLFWALQNVKQPKFSRLHPWIPLQRVSGDSPAVQQFFSSLCLLKNCPPPPHPPPKKKLLDIYLNIQMKNLLMLFTIF